MADSGDISIERADDATLVVHLRGSWQLENGLPPVEPVERELSAAKAKKLAFDTRELRDWDSALVSFLENVRERNADPFGYVRPAFFTLHLGDLAARGKAFQLGQ